MKKTIFLRKLFKRKKEFISFIFVLNLVLILIWGSSVSSYTINYNYPNITNDLFVPESCPEKEIYFEKTGFIPPELDLIHLSGQIIPKKYTIESPPSNFDWRTKGIITPVKDQGDCGACYAFASLGCFESMIKLHSGSTFDLSEDNVKECEYYHGCCSGGNFYKVSSYLSQSGTVLESCDPYLPYHNTNPSCDYCDRKHTLLDWRIISGDYIANTNVLKNYIYNEGPVYVSMWLGTGSWEDEFLDYDGSYTLYYGGSTTTSNWHAVMIIGWDDSLIHSGGSGGWICKNSWGTDWGGPCGYGTEKGYFTIAYESADIGKYSSFLDQWGNHDTSGGIAYYDEGGWSDSWGYPSGSTPTVAWGLCGFYLWGEVDITRVEFWTNDAPTNIDLYIYDNFDGSTLTNLLHSSLDHTFSEAGYHGIAIVPPLNKLGMDNIYVAIEFRNDNYRYPVVCDKNGPSESGKTFLSPTGASGSWEDLGENSVDAAIRLRCTTSNNPPTEPTISGPSTGNENKNYNFDFLSIDSDGDKISYYIDWGDDEITDWTSFRNSGVKYVGTHSWDSQGTYLIKSKARDIYGVESDLSEKQIEIPRNRIFSNPFYQLLIERFTNMIFKIRNIID
jgi:C1A family cysteine protease